MGLGARRFWRDEYRMNALLAEYPKPIAVFAQGFTMGGGVGLAGHVSHRIVGDSAQIAMPECGIGLVPDVGGSLLLARAPGRLGEYLGLTAARMGPGDALHCGFADFYIPEDAWPALKEALIETGDPAAIAAAAKPAPESPLAAQQPEIDALFAGERLIDIVNALKASQTDFAAAALKSLSRNAPLSMAVTLEMIHRHRAGTPDIRKALAPLHAPRHAPGRFPRRCARAGHRQGPRAQVAACPRRRASGGGGRDAAACARRRAPFPRPFGTGDHRHENRIYRPRQYGRPDGPEPREGGP